ncbi:MAG: F0F1 ATP synthase subunit A [Dysgonamonadaceae bacterium]|jgi:F-type H+-transporting ATPase subunit a|nr:F0F1 ATP synthase subunit A [Dysgonamonadaceae bacterium]
MKTYAIYKHLIIILLLIYSTGASAQNEAEHLADAAPAHETPGGKLNVTEMILEHVGDAYDWHVATVGEHNVSIPLPVIVRSQNDGWNVFLSSRFEHGHAEYRGFSIANEGKFKGKIVENTAGKEVRPLDLSLTKNAVSLILSSIFLIWTVMSCASWYKKRKAEEASPKGLVGMIEMLIMSIVNDVIKPCIGKNYARYSPFLLTVFFFIFINNLMGIIPFFPGGANVTGNIAVTSVLAIFTFIVVNSFGTREYWKEIFWPDVPVWLKVVPIMPAIELVGVFTKPFALMIRLFANILAGHSIVLGLTSVIFITVNLGAAMNAGMTALSVIMTVFIGFVELLVAFIQAYVFTMLSAVFIGLSQIEAHHTKELK